MALRSVLITGANRGLGLALTQLLLDRGLDVIACSRSKDGLAELEKLNGDGLAGRLTPMLFDVEAKMFSPEVLDALKQVHAVVNNAGWGADLPNDIEGGCNSLLDMDPDVFERAMEVNARSVLRIMKVCVPQMKERGFGRVVNVGSSRAKMSEIVGDVMAPAYGLSKILLNGLTALMGHELRDTNVLVNSVCPGWCQTRMGGPNALETADSGAEKIAFVLDLPDFGPNGKFFINNQISEY